MSFFHGTELSDKSAYSHYETVKMPGRVSTTTTCTLTNLIVDCFWHRLLLTKTSTQQLETNGSRRRMEGHFGQVKNQFRMYYSLTTYGIPSMADVT